MVRKQQVAAAVRRALVMSAMAAAGVAAPALAQENLGEIVVTGSRIRPANLESTTPVTQVTAADVVTQGVTRIEDLVNQLPQAFAAQNVTVSNGATGSATLDLRDLGSPRTLVLIDGRRMPYGGVQAASAAPDINQIPTSMIERVDVLTGGASAVYGSDAVAGVVNFIMKKDFEGVQVTSQYNFYWHENDFGGPGEMKLRDTIEQLARSQPLGVQAAAGLRDGRRRQGTLADGRRQQRRRPRQPHGLRDGIRQQEHPPGGPRLLGLLAEPEPGRLLHLRRLFDQRRRAFTDFATYDFTIDTADSFRNFTANDLYNYGPLNYYQRPERRYSLGAMGHYEFGEHADVYTQLMFTDYESVAQIAPAGTSSTGTINCNNPFLPATTSPTSVAAPPKSRPAIR